MEDAYPGAGATAAMPRRWSPLTVEFSKFLFPMMDQRDWGWKWPWMTGLVFVNTNQQWNAIYSGERDHRHLRKLTKTRLQEHLAGEVKLYYTLGQHAQGITSDKLEKHRGQHEAPAAMPMRKAA